VNWGGAGATCDGALNRCSQGFCPDVTFGSTAPRFCPTIASDGQACDTNSQAVQCTYGSACAPNSDGGTTGTCSFGFAACM
jgi:hypothetical protein